MLDGGGHVHIRHITPSPLVNVGCYNPLPLRARSPRRHICTTRQSGYDTKLSYPGIGFAVTRYCPLWPPLFAFTVLFLGTHEQLPNRSPILGLLYPQLAYLRNSHDSEANELPKGLVLDRGGMDSKRDEVGVWIWVEKKIERKRKNWVLRAKL
ncbi:unnamed protein product [Prunus armeniaca]